MEYHSDRFEDASVLIFKDDSLKAICPLNKVGETAFSHQGLTYGGLVFSENANLEEQLEIFECLLLYLKSNTINELVLKALPDLYQNKPHNELAYIMCKLKANVSKCELTSALQPSDDSIKKSNNRKRGLKRGLNHSLKVKEEDNFESFWNAVLIPNLKERFDTSPVHSFAEIRKLKQHFPNEIRQFNVYHENEIVGGVTIFETKNVAHAQYISATSNRQELGTLDVLFNHLINDVYKEKRYFDFGTSSENGGHSINQGLFNWKLSFGSQIFNQMTYTINTNNNTNLNSVWQ